MGFNSGFKGLIIDYHIFVLSAQDLKILPCDPVRQLR